MSAVAPDDEVTLQIDRAASPAAAHPELSLVRRAGEIFADRYLVESHLGRGGMGDVYRVRDQQSGMVAALKVMLPSTLESPGAVERFRREVAMLARVVHPAVPRVLDFGVADGVFFFVAEFVDGRTLRAVVTAGGSLPLEHACRLVAEVADALHAAHLLGIVHRDVKSGNIMLDEQGGVHLLDFGLARGCGPDMPTITRTGMMVGTPEYMAPEQVDSHKVDPRSDIYSLGVVLFELLTGALPFSASTPVALAMKHKSEPPPRLREVRREAPMWLEQLVQRCLAKDPNQRFQAANDLAAMLRAPRSAEAPRRRTLRGGDLAIEDGAELTDWPLVLLSKEANADWAEGMALQYGGRHYKLCLVTEPQQRGERWSYHFVEWPANEIFRRLVDYDEHVSDQLERRNRGFLGSFRR